MAGLASFAILMPGYLDLGATVYVFIQDFLAREDPTNWYLWIGLMLLAIVFLAPGGLTAWLGALAQRGVRKRS